MSVPTFVIGDIHGQYQKLLKLLHKNGFVQESGRWCGGAVRLWFLGDFCDRGPQGTDVVRLIRRLEIEAATVGGFVGALLGNHEPMLLAAKRFPKHYSASGHTFESIWLMNGGQMSDLESLNVHDLHWMASRPAMALEGETLLLHADSGFYTQYGQTIRDVNDMFADAMLYGNHIEIDEMIMQFGRRKEFLDDPELLDDFLHIYSAKRLIHGHTPIPYITQRVTNTHYTYAHGRATDVDAGLVYEGSKGFVYQLPETIVVE